jgi:alpha-L-fucosidase
MIRKAIPLTCLLIPLFFTTLKAQKYEPTWASLDSREVAPWFSEAKFGIFIHWGPYSVPAWSPKGTYTEWYQYWLQTESIFGNGDFTGQEIPEFHRNTYGDDFTYYDFAKMWKAEMYDPDEWAELFKKAGARYVVMTSKHHDGFALWPSMQANKTWGFKWNSIETGPRRDLVGDYMQAIRKVGLKAGLYYSIYEWFNPWYRIKSEKFITDHFHPQFKDLVTRYQPDLIYADGEWEQTNEYWKSRELLTWLFNESPVKDKVVINDRWEKGQRFKHGGYFTNEYDAGAQEGWERPWEEIRGMGLSFGYNRNEDIGNYNAPRTLVLMLVDVVSQGGNLCLNVGPNAAGEIPVIMQERLLQIGKWLEINGEAIYGTTKWERAVQWSKGDREYDFDSMYKSYVEGEYILYQTIWPMAGKALKEVFFTRKGNDIYAIVPNWPGTKLVIRDMKLKRGARISWLASGKRLEWKKKGRNVEVEIPPFNPGDWTDESMYAFVLKIEQ